MLFKMLKRIDELEQENEELKRVILKKDNMLGGISQKCTAYKQTNRYNSNYGFDTIKEMAQIGLDIKKEADVTPTSNN